ncbi:MAG: hypothetical protein AAF823_05350 [Planctomycetota bacterium]
MYGVDSSLDLSMFHGGTCIQVAIGQFCCQLAFHPDARLTIEGSWSLLGPDRLEIDRSCGLEERDCFRLHRVLGMVVAQAIAEPPSSIVIEFEDGTCLRVFDDRSNFESFTIEPGGIVV